MRIRLSLHSCFSPSLPESNSVCPAGWKDLFVVFAGTEWDSTCQSNRCQASVQRRRDKEAAFEVGNSLVGWLAYEPLIATQKLECRILSLSKTLSSANALGISRHFKKMKLRRAE